MPLALSDSVKTAWGSSVSDRITTGKQVPTYDNDRMECVYRFRLPCRHTPYLKLCENHGMEICETFGQVQVPLEDGRVRVKSLLHMREIDEQLLQQLHGPYEVREKEMH